MGRMKDLLITIYNGGDEAVAAVERMGKDWRAQLEQAAKEVEGLRLTDAERGAVEFFAEAGVYWSTREGVGHARSLLGLLKRTPEAHSTLGGCR